ncbi:MAG: biopolymer transporter ExbD [Methylacidiphilales bacterium]|nr:biopolymer transporter ExbD [Candidatus Methylacidiphilales bacterium]MDW8348808.1 biopolymer transporter ExbD [Verrucomicrobiae bacterium]
MRFYQAQRRKPTISIVSLIDILTIVLLFYVVTTTFRREEPTIKIELPQSSHAESKREPPPNIIYVDAQQNIYLNTEPITLAELPKALSNILITQKQGDIAMRASKDAPFSIIVAVMDAAKEAGISHLPTFTEPAPR